MYEDYIIIYYIIMPAIKCPKLVTVSFLLTSDLQHPPTNIGFGMFWYVLVISSIFLSAVCAWALVTWHHSHDMSWFGVTLLPYCWWVVARHHISGKSWGVDHGLLMFIFFPNCTNNTSHQLMIYSCYTNLSINLPTNVTHIVVAW